ncbi:hypothetical protein U9M48_007936 [Paspalum notatum var. saurae]|uniref:DUF3527 domain protein n=1 Tax=Paspalum notatum var. saurae TaxID=547442 RepID=A0AAQ3WCB5_PASNO
MGSRSRLGAGKESMRPISEEMESTTKETETSKFFQLKCTDETLKEPCLDRTPNFHCKSLPSRYRDANPEDNIMHKRGSMYQSSGEVSRLRNLQGRSKVNYSSNKDTFLSFEVVSSSSQPSTSGASFFPQRSYSCNARSAMGTHHRIHQASREFLKLSLHEIPEDDLTLERPRRDCNLLKNDAIDSFLEISLEEDTTNGSCTNAAPNLLEGSCSKVARSDHQQSVGSCPDERDVANLPKSRSTKVGVFDATCPSECAGNKKARSSPFKKILDPIMKSKSQRNPSLTEKEELRSNSMPFGGKSRVLRKSLLSDISRAEQSLTTECQINGESQQLTATSSPTHLHAVIKLDPNNGAFGFVFCTKDPEELIYANTWKAGNELNWIYTFHSSGKRASTVGRASSSKDRRGCLPPIIGQMHVSSYLYSNVGEDGTLNNSATTEFVLYDIAHARRSSAVERIQCTDAIRPSFCNVVNNSGSGHTRNDLMQRQNTTRNDSDLSISCLWSREDLHPHLEVAAIVIQVPIHKIKSKELKAGSSPGTIKAVTAGGAHGLPRDDEASPSPLLDRLKSGGACDCGGWDMSCPIVVLDNAYDSYWAESVMNGSKSPMDLFAQGNKEVLPALSMKADGNGHFSVDFHARLSALQAFSICISLLHCSEASSDIGIEKFKNKLYSSSLKMVLKEEVKQLIDSVMTKEKKKPKSRNKKAPPSIVIDPPFSPMGRV